MPPWGTASTGLVVPGRYSSVPLLWAQDILQGQQAKAVPRAGGEHLDLLSTSLGCLHPLSFPPHPALLSNTACQGVEGLLGTHYSWLQPSSHAPSSLACPTHQPAHPSPGVGARGLLSSDRVCPGTWGGLWVSACQVHATCAAVCDGCLSAQGLACPCLPSCCGPRLGWEVKGGD